MIIPVEKFGNPESKKGRAVFYICTVELTGLHGRAIINYDYTYTAWYHFDP